MRSFIFIACCVVSSAVLSSAVLAAEPQYVAADNSIESALCVSAATANRFEFQQQLESLRVRPAVAANKLMCNDLPVASFAQQAGNTVVYQQLKRYIKGQVDIQDIALVPAHGVVLLRGR